METGFEVPRVVKISSVVLNGDDENIIATLSFIQAFSYKW